MADKKADALKKRFKPVKEKAEKISTLLFTKKNVGDTNEYVNTLKSICAAIEMYDKLKAKEKTFPADDGARIVQLMQEYEQIVMPLTTDDKRFARFFGGSRVRRRLDQVNAELHTEIFKILTTSPAYIEKKKKEDQKKEKEKDKKKSSKKDGLSPSMYILDEEGRALWEGSFDQTLIIEWSRFVDVLRKKITVDEEAEELLRYVLDNANTGTVSIYKFGDFLTGLGPLQQCVAKAKAVFNSNWFHGFLTSPEAERILDRQQHGTFLIRFSKSKSGSFAMAYVDGNLRNVVHTLIECHPKNGYQILETFNKNAQGRNFASLQQVVDFYNGILIHPVQTELTKLNFFHGDLTSQEAEDILSSQPEGSYLFRFSSKVPTLAISYVENNRVNHGTLECLNGGYRFENNNHVYRSLNDIVLSLHDVLRNPIEVSTCDYRATAQHKRRGTVTAYRPRDLPDAQPVQEEAPAPQPIGSLYAPINTANDSHRAGGVNKTVPSPTIPASPQPVQAVSPVSSPGPSIRPGSTNATPLRSHSSTTSVPVVASGGDGAYGQMPTPTQMMSPQPVRVVSPPVQQPTAADNGTYGQMPTPTQMMSPQPIRVASPPVQQPADNGTYGQMPTPTQLASPMASRPTITPSIMSATASTHAPVETSNYGQMPTPTQLAGSGSVLRGSTGGLGSSSSGEGAYGQMPAPQTRVMSPGLAPRAPGGASLMSQSVASAPASSSAAESNYGQMPAPSQLHAISSGSVLAPTGSLPPPTGSMGSSTGANAYASFSAMQIMGGGDRSVAPVAPPKPSAQSFVMPTSPPQKRADEGNYGQMPTPSALHAASQGSAYKPAIPAQTQGQPADEGNYGQMPTPSSLFAVKKTAVAPPPNNLQEDDPEGRGVGYHSMPDTVKSQFLASQGGGSALGAPRKSVVVMNSSGTGYEEREITSPLAPKSPPSGSSSASDTYGRMPMPTGRPVSTIPHSSLQHNKTLPGTPVKPLGSTDHYATIPAPSSPLAPAKGGASALAHSISTGSLPTTTAPLSPSSSGMYGSMPPPQKSTNPTAALPPPKSALARSNEPLGRTVSTPVLTGSSDTYGSMPMPQNRAPSSTFSSGYGSIIAPAKSGDEEINNGKRMSIVRPNSGNRQSFRD